MESVGLRHNSLYLTATLLSVVSLILSACGPSKIPAFSIANYCSGNTDLKTRTGEILSGPAQCGDFVFSATQIDPIDSNSILTGSATFYSNIKNSDVSGNFSQISINPNLPSCMTQIINKKERGYNGAVANFFQRARVWQHFVTKKNGGEEISPGGHTLHDATAARELLLGLSPDEKSCIQDYSPGQYPDTYFDFLAEQPTLEALSANGKISDSAFCSILSGAVDANGEIGGIDNNAEGYEEIVTVGDEYDCFPK